VIETELLDRVAGAGLAGWGALLVAPFVGSFIGVVVRRVPEGRPVAWTRSRCEHCGTVLRVRDLVPLYSWLTARGRCRYCGHSLSRFYPGIELAAFAIAFAGVAFDGGTEAWLDCVFGWWLLALGWIDIRRWLLPDVLTLPLVITGLAAAAAFDPEQLTERGSVPLSAISACVRLRWRIEPCGAAKGWVMATPNCLRHRELGWARWRCRRWCLALRSRR
jgi:prepilin signal peptidase PulO-like enzyme (type II secretory pathway)